jgi:hypothetical protein
MSEGRELQGVVIDQQASISHCRSCGGRIWWGRTAAGKRCPFDVHIEDLTRPVRTTITHFSTCPDARNWGKRA